MNQTSQNYVQFHAVLCYNICCVVLNTEESPTEHQPFWQVFHFFISTSISDHYTSPISILSDNPMLKGRFDKVLIVITIVTSRVLEQCEEQTLMKPDFKTPHFLKCQIC